MTYFYFINLSKKHCLDKNTANVFVWEAYDTLRYATDFLKISLAEFFVFHFFSFFLRLAIFTFLQFTGIAAKFKSMTTVKT
jgi:hypothetical protein